MNEKTSTALKVINSQQGSFAKLVEKNKSHLVWENECMFARQQVMKNDFTAEVAANNPQSLQAAILNVANIGITLNPANAWAYLVPRDGSICLDISYKGLVKLATDSGAVKWAKAELVHANDKFTYRGINKKPKIEASVFDADRGDVIGVYCIAKLTDGEVLVDTMTTADINDIRDTSKAYQKRKGPWVNYWGEMAKKTIIKRASKSWPQTEARQVFDQAVEILHETEGTAYSFDQHAKYLELLRDQNAIDFLQMQHSVSENVWNALYNSAEKGGKVEHKKAHDALYMLGVELANNSAVEFDQAVNDGDLMGAQEIWEEFGSDILSPLIADGSLDKFEIMKAEAA